MAGGRPGGLASGARCEWQPQAVSTPFPAWEINSRILPGAGEALPSGRTASPPEFASISGRFLTPPGGRRGLALSAWTGAPVNPDSRTA